jgi:hypothetical protein
MKIGKRGIRIIRNSFRLRPTGKQLDGKSKARGSEATCLDMSECMEPESEHQLEHEVCEDSKTKTALSPLADILSGFIVDSAQRTYQNLESETERNEFLLGLQQALESIGIGKEPSVKNTVVRLLAETVQSALESIDNDAERNRFLRYLSDHLNQVGQRTEN